MLVINKCNTDGNNGNDLQNPARGIRACLLASVAAACVDEGAGGTTSGCFNTLKIVYRLS